MTGSMNRTLTVNSRQARRQSKIKIKFTSILIFPLKQEERMNMEIIFGKAQLIHYGEAVRLRMVKKKFNISFDLQYIILYIIIEMQYIISGELKWRETN